MRCWGARSVGKRVRLLAHDFRDADSAELAGGLSSDPILSSLRRTTSNNCLYPGSDHTSFHLYKSNEPLPIFFFRLDRKGEEDRLPLFHLSLPPAGGAAGTSAATPPGGGLLGTPATGTPTAGMPFRDKGGILHRLSFSLGYGTFFKEGQVLV